MKNCPYMEEWLIECHHNGHSMHWICSHFFQRFDPSMQCRKITSIKKQVTFWLLIFFLLRAQDGLGGKSQTVILFEKLKTVTFFPENHCDWWPPPPHTSGAGNYVMSLIPVQKLQNKCAFLRIMKSSILTTTRAEKTICKVQI